MAVETGGIPRTKATAPVVGAFRSTVELSVEGMHCQSCALLIEETLVEDPAVDRVVVDRDGTRATVTFDSGAISVGALCAVVTGLGYPTSPLAPGDPRQ